jgi:hypothetical protein
MCNLYTSWHSEWATAAATAATAVAGTAHRQRAAAIAAYGAKHARLAPRRSSPIADIPTNSIATVKIAKNELAECRVAIAAALQQAAS